MTLRQISFLVNFDPSQSAFVRGFIDDAAALNDLLYDNDVSIRVRARLHR